MRILTIILSLLATPIIADHELEGRNLQAGQDLYQRHCASCHGANLEGQPDWQRANDDGTLPAPPHDETGHTWHHDSQLLFSYTKLGGAATLAQRGVAEFQSGMPGFATALSDDEIWDILSFIQSTWPQRIQEIQASRNPPH